jgi:signal transduction histidine kinase
MTSNTHKDLSLILAEKQRAMEDLREEKSSLLRVISHDIKSPFNQLFALIQLFELEAETLSDRQNEYIDKMYHAVISGIEMIQNLQDFRAIDEDNLQVHVEKLDVNQVLKKLVARYQIQSRLHKVKINLQETTQSVVIYTDELLILKILEKILSNAIRYCGQEKTVDVGFEKMDGQVWIHVNDEGPGLTKSEMPFIFEPFRTLSAKPTEGGGTTGLGMYVAHKIANLLGFEIRINKNPKGGLEVSLKIPK